MSVLTDARPLADAPTIHDATTASSVEPAGAGDRVLGATRALLAAFVVFTALAVISLLLLGGRTDTTFAWTIQSRPNASFLGAAYLAGFVLSVLALRQRHWSDIRVPVVTVTVFTALTLVPTLLHMHKLHLMAGAGTARMAGWVWLVVYLIVPIGGSVVIVRQGRLERHALVAPGSERRQERVVGRPMPKPLAGLLLVQGMIMAAAGLILVVGGAMSHMTVDVQRPGWAYPVTPLTSQAIGAWMLAFAAAIVLAVRERDLSRMFVPAFAYAVFGAVELAVLVAHRTAPSTNVGWWWADALVLASLIPTGAYGVWAARREVDA
jgi:hypothetical protein